MPKTQFEATIDAVVHAVTARLGEHRHDAALVQLVTREVVAALVAEGSDITRPHDNPLALRSSSGPSRAVITSSGKNCRGVVAAIASEIAHAGGDIQDMSQTIVADFFTMIMLVDISALTVSFAELKQMVQHAAERLGFDIRVMHEDVLRALQRV